MGEATAIGRSSTLNTRATLRSDFERLGLAPGMIVLVHSSLSALGYVCGGPVAVIQALQDVLTPTGTLVMPTHTGDYSDPAGWQHPPVPADWWATMRATMPAFDPHLTPTRAMGAIPELFRTWPEVVRSNHPATSFAAWGAQREAITADHSLNNGLGEQSPLAQIYKRGGWVLLLGVGHSNNTSLHLAEHRLPATQVTVGAPIMEQGRRVWKTFDDIELDDRQFPALGSALEATTTLVQLGPVGAATARLMPQPPVVDFGVAWLRQQRGG